MSNEHGQPEADPAGNQPTQQFWAGPDAPTAMPAWGNQPGAAGPPGPGYTGRPAPSLRKDYHKALHWTAGLLVAALLAGGGIIAGMRLAAHSSPGTSSGAATAQAGAIGTAQQGALLNAALSDASSPGALTLTGGSGASSGGAAAGAAGQAPACARARHVSRVARRSGLPTLSRRIGIGAVHCRRARRRVFAFFLLRGVDGQFTIQTRKGIKTLAYERGVIQSVTAGKSITVKASDGTTWTWDLVSTTVVRDRQGKIGQSALTSGTPVWAGGPVVQGTKDARLIVVRPPQPASVPPSSTSGS